MGRLARNLGKNYLLQRLNVFVWLVGKISFAVVQHLFVRESEIVWPGIAERSYAREIPRRPAGENAELRNDAARGRRRAQGSTKRT
jgi:hypothetical protein